MYEAGGPEAFSPTQAQPTCEDLLLCSPVAYVICYMFFWFRRFWTRALPESFQPSSLHQQSLKHAVESTRIKRTKKNSNCHLWIHGVNPYGCHIMNPVVIGAWTLTLGRPPAAAWGVVRPYPTSTRSIGNPPMACSCGLSQGAGPPPCCRLRAWAPDRSANSPSLVAYNTEH